jgi:hypothetical protein
MVSANEPDVVKGSNVCDVYLPSYLVGVLSSHLGVWSIGF